MGRQADAFVGRARLLSDAGDHISGGVQFSYFSNNVSPSVLLAGVNQLAVEIHQASSNNVDGAFDLELLGQPVPCTPPFVLGIINLRGEIRTVIDLKKFFDLAAVGITERNKIILIEQGGMQLGILADAIRGVRHIPLADLQPALPTLTDIRDDYLRGITSERLVVLDAAKILSDPRILVDDNEQT